MSEKTPSSDDLIARAREDLRRPAADVPPPRVQPPAATEPPSDRVIEQLSRSPVQAPQRDTAGADSPSVASPLPDPVPPASPRSGFASLWARRGWIVGAVVLAGAAWSFFDDSKAVEALGPGDCFDDPGVETVYEVDGISCSGAHDYEVFATVRVGSADDAYPGDEALFLTAWDNCFPHFEPYVGTAYADSVYYFDSMIPTPDGWSEGDREATCVLFKVDADEEDIVKTNGSARDSGR